MRKMSSDNGRRVRGMRVPVGVVRVDDAPCHIYRCFNPRPLHFHIDWSIFKIGKTNKIEEITITSSLSGAIRVLSRKIEYQ